jgi:drug/metabolite transporter (DMT)-like permease
MIKASIIMSSNPILATLIAATMRREHLAKIPLFGVFLGFVAAEVMINSWNGAEFGVSTLRGNLFVFINSATLALY